MHCLNTAGHCSTFYKANPLFLLKLLVETSNCLFYTFSNNERLGSMKTIKTVLPVPLIKLVSQKTISSLSYLSVLQA